VNIVIFGANGPTGRQATAQAMAEGHTPFEEIPPERLRQAMPAQGLTEDVPDRMIGYAAACLKQPGPTTDTVARLLGRPALTFATRAAEHAAAFRN
jgi:hypothetical protein